MGFQQEVINQMCRINQTLIEIRDKEITAETLKGTYSSWSYQRTGKSWFLERLITFAGTTMTVNLDLLDLIKSISKISTVPQAFKVNRIEQIFNDGTARTYSVRAYSNSAFSAYIEIDAGTADTSNNISIEGEYKYPRELRVQWYYSSFTVDKTVRLRVQVDEL